MRQSCFVLYGFLPLVLAFGGCVRRYEEPPITEPHALVKFRVLHHAVFPNSLSEAVRLDGYDIALPPGAPTSARLRTVRVRPVLSRYRFATEYFHTYTTTRTEFYTESYSCGSTRSPRNCTRNRSRTVRHTQHITDAACETAMEHIPMAGGVYLIQYDFYGHGTCNVSCFRQLDGAGAEFQLVPCGPGEPPVYGGSSGGESIAR
jgi:hypothetical protein